jgi:hypothetical protein
MNATTITNEAYGMNETWNLGIYANNDGTFTAMTWTQSKDFKTRKGAVNWLAVRGYNEDGTRK